MEFKTLIGQIKVKDLKKLQIDKDSKVDQSRKRQISQIDADRSKLEDEVNSLQRNLKLIESRAFYEGKESEKELLHRLQAKKNLRAFYFNKLEYMDKNLDY